MYATDVPSLKALRRDGPPGGETWQFRVRKYDAAIMSDNIGILCSPQRQKTGTPSSFLRDFQMTRAGFGCIFQVSFVLPKHRSAREDEDGGTSACVRTQPDKGQPEEPETRGEYRKTGVENDRSKIGGLLGAVLRDTVAHHLLNHGHRRHPFCCTGVKHTLFFCRDVY